MALDLAKTRSKEVQEFLHDGRWYPYPNDEDISVKIRPLVGKVVNRIQEQCEKKARRGGAPILDEKKMNRLFRKHAVADWKGVTWEGKPIPPDEEHIETAFNYAPEFAIWIVETAQDAGRELEEGLEVKRENFSGISEQAASGQELPKDATSA